jgi:glycosyltransferase involved in cell wall biosynthesis
VRILYVINEDSYFWTHRRHLAVAAQRAGWDVTVATRLGSHEEAIRDAGFAVERLDFQRGFPGPSQDLRTIRHLVEIYRRVRPDLVHHVSLKLVTYGSLAAKLAGVPRVVNAFAGLGYVFTGTDARARVLRAAMIPALRACLPRRNTISIFQNREDKALLERLRCVEARTSRLIPGSGVDVDAFQPSEERDGPPLFVLPARMLWSKGVGQFVEAARLVLQRGLKARFALAGSLDETSLDAVPRETLEAWTREGVVEWWGHRDDMAGVYRDAHVVTLPTYYGEGLPKVLLEACASGRAVLATDIAGCREVIQSGVNGLLVPPKDVPALAEAMMRLGTDVALRRSYAARGRDVVVRELSVQHVVAATMGVYRELLGGDMERPLASPAFKPTAGQSRPQ